MTDDLALWEAEVGIDWPGDTDLGDATADAEPPLVLLWACALVCTAAVLVLVAAGFAIGWYLI